MNGVLVLNASYEPLNIVSVQRAIVLLLKEKAELVEAAKAKIRAERLQMEVPLVIRLVTYVPIPRRLPLPLSRRTVLARDMYTCQYCGTTGIPLTIDHVVPRSRRTPEHPNGGASAWDNCVAACFPCNTRKGNRTPEEAGMKLLNPPSKPRWYFALIHRRRGAVVPPALSHDPQWSKYLA